MTMIYITSYAYWNNASVGEPQVSNVWPEESQVSNKILLEEKLVSMHTCRESKIDWRVRYRSVYKSEVKFREGGPELSPEWILAPSVVLIYPQSCGFAYVFQVGSHSAVRPNPRQCSGFAAWLGKTLYYIFGFCLRQPPGVQRKKNSDFKSFFAVDREAN